MSTRRNAIIHVNSMQEIAGVVRQRRKDLELTQIEVSKMAGISRARYLSIERGRTVEGLEFHHLHKLLIILGLSLVIKVTHSLDEVREYHKSALRIPREVSLLLPSIWNATKPKMKGKLKRTKPKNKIKKRKALKKGAGKQRAGRRSSLKGMIKD